MILCGGRIRIPKARLTSVLGGYFSKIPILKTCLFPLGHY